MGTQLVVVVVDLFDEPDETVFVDVLAEPAGRLTDACCEQERLRGADDPVAADTSWSSRPTARTNF